MNYQTIERIGAPADAPSGSTWSYNGTLVPHPITFAAHHVNSNSPTQPSVYSVTNNAQIDGLTHRAKFSNFRSVARRWRLAYASATIIQDGPDLANQGTIVVAQVPLQPAFVNASFELPNPGAPLRERFVVAMPRIGVFHSSDLPDFASSQGMPNAYFNSSKQGAYIPLKLTKTCQEWHSSSDAMLVAPTANRNADETGSQFESGLTALSPGQEATWPFLDVNPAAVPLKAVGFDSDTMATIGDIPNDPITYAGDLTSALCNDVCAQITAQNMAVTTSLQIFYRFGFELQVLPQTMFSPQQKISPPYDGRAIKTYFAVSRELKDAYPEDYNSLGKIMKTIGEVVSDLVAPAANLIVPGSGRFINMLGQKAQDYGKRKEISDRELQTTVSAASLDKAQSARKDKQKSRPKAPPPSPAPGRRLRVQRPNRK